MLSLQEKKELQDLREFKAKMDRFIAQLQFVTSGHPFICGTAGEPYKNGMFDVFYICAAYGSDAVYRYKRDDKWV